MNTTLERLEHEEQALHSALQGVQQAINSLNGDAPTGDNGTTAKMDPTLDGTKTGAPTPVTPTVHWTRRMTPRQRAAWKQAISNGHKKRQRALKKARR